MRPALELSALLLSAALGMYAAIVAMVPRADAACTSGGANTIVCNPPTAHTSTIGTSRFDVSVSIDLH